MISITAVLVIGCIFEERYITNSFKWLINNLETIQIELTENKEQIDTEEFILKSHTLHEDWHKKVKVLKCIIWHTGIKDVEVGLARISVYIEENDYTEAYAELASLIDYCAHYLEDFSITSENIL